MVPVRRMRQGRLISVFWTFCRERGGGSWADKLDPVFSYACQKTQREAPARLDLLKNKPATTFAGGVYRRSESSSRRTAPTWFGITDAFSPADKLPERYLQSAALPTTI